MSELVERLKAYAKDQGGWHNIDDTCEEAAAEITRLTGELAEAYTTLRQIADGKAPKGASELLAANFMAEVAADSPARPIAALVTELSASQARVAVLEEALRPFAVPASKFLPDNLWTECKTYVFDAALLENRLPEGASNPREILWLDGHPISDFRRAARAMEGK